MIRFRKFQILLYIIVYAAACTLCTGCTARTPVDNSGVSEITDRQEPVHDSDTGELNPQQLLSVPADLEETVEAQPGDAFLAVTDANSFLQYWGEKTDILSYSAVTVPVKQDGSYTVSVTADTRAARYDATGNPEGELTASGLSFLSVMIRDGETLCPDAVITVDRISVDGRNLDTTAENFTVAEAGNLRADIWNPYLESIPADAVCEKGAFFVKGDINQPAFDAGEDYSAQIIRAGRIKEWKTITVQFTVSDFSGKKENKAADKKAKPKNT